MDIARCLDTIDVLCARDLAQAPGRTDAGEAGPGYLIAELATSDDFWDDDGTAREATEEQYEADRDGLTERLTARWGPPDRFGLAGVLIRSMEGEEIPEPWHALSNHVPDLHLWRLPGSDRWVALGVSQWDKELPFQLLAVVTEVDPP
ncbi:MULTISPECIES: hypothetical protein [unclassified Streptomyces]|uniref:hypothetical protein n=1 Tax=unclassified Streptomyces TaxID=2593676 RepID=UPI003D70FBF5